MSTKKKDAGSPEKEKPGQPGENTAEETAKNGTASGETGTAPAPEEKSAGQAAPESKGAPEAKPAAPTPEELLKTEKDKYLRLLAEYDNYRKRSCRERESIYADVRADTVTKFLPVYDNLMRALEQSTEDEAYRKGVEMIMAQMKETLSGLGVCEIEAVGKKFDPALHNAVLHDTDETKGEGEIVQELQKGFKIGDKVIRFAMVKTVN